MASKKTPVSKPKKNLLAEVEQKVERFYELNTQRKAIEKEEAELKDWFKSQTGPEESADFAHGDIVCSVNVKPGKTSIDADQVRKVLSTEALAACMKTGAAYKEVTVRKTKAEGAA